MNIGLTNWILDILNNKTAMFYKDIYTAARGRYPNITSNQLSGTLSSLERYGRILHISTHAWACVDYPYR